jgi:hypothetical protein
VSSKISELGPKYSPRPPSKSKTSLQQQQQNFPENRPMHRTITTIKDNEENKNTKDKKKSLEELIKVMQTQNIQNLFGKPSLIVFDAYHYISTRLDDFERHSNQSRRNGKGYRKH